MVGLEVLPLEHGGGTVESIGFYHEYGSTIPVTKVRYGDFCVCVLFFVFFWLLRLGLRIS